MLDGTEIVYIARGSQKRVMSINLSPGPRLPAYCASIGRVLLAALPEREARAILDHTDLRSNTPLMKTDPDILMEELGRVRADGRAVNDQELGQCSIAVPVENDRGRVIAAINIGAPAAHVTASEMTARYLPLLMETQKALRLVLY